MPLKPFWCSECRTAYVLHEIFIDWLLCLTVHAGLVAGNKFYIWTLFRQKRQHSTIYIAFLPHQTTRHNRHPQSFLIATEINGRMKTYWNVPDRPKSEIHTYLIVCKRVLDRRQSCYNRHWSHAIVSNRVPRANLTKKSTISYDSAIVMIVVVIVIVWT